MGFVINPISNDVVKIPPLPYILFEVLVTETLECGNELRNDTISLFHIGVVGIHRFLVFCRDRHGVGTGTVGDACPYNARQDTLSVLGTYGNKVRTVSAIIISL